MAKAKAFCMSLMIVIILFKFFSNKVHCFGQHHRCWNISALPLNLVPVTVCFIHFQIKNGLFLHCYSSLLIRFFRLVFCRLVDIIIKYNHKNRAEASSGNCTHFSTDVLTRALKYNFHGCIVQQLATWQTSCFLTCSCVTARHWSPSESTPSSTLPSQTSFWRSFHAYLKNIFRFCMTNAYPSP